MKKPKGRKIPRRRKKYNNGRRPCGKNNAHTILGILGLMRLAYPRGDIRKSLKKMGNEDETSGLLLLLSR